MIHPSVRGMVCPSFKGTDRSDEAMYLVKTFAMAIKIEPREAHGVSSEGKNFVDGK